MPWGPVEWIVVEFPGSRFRGEIVPELAKLVDTGTIHIIDLLVVHKDADGTVHAVELDALDPDEAGPFEHLDGEVMGLLSHDDITLAAASTAALLVWENALAAAFASAVRSAHGRVVAYERVPHEIVAAAVAAAEDGAAIEGGVTA